MDLRQAILAIVNDNVSFKGIRLGNIVSVDTSSRTCVVNVLDSETDIEGVRIHVTGQSESGLFYKPSIGSLVGIAPLFAFEYAVVLYSQIDEIIFLDGSYGGIVRVEDLTTKLNNLENKVNDLINYINIHVHPGNGSPPTTPYSGGTLTPTNQSEIENLSIQHGV